MANVCNRVGDARWSARALAIVSVRRKISGSDCQCDEHANSLVDKTTWQPVAGQVRVNVLAVLTIVRNLGIVP